MGLAGVFTCRAGVDGDGGTPVFVVRGGGQVDGVVAGRAFDWDGEPVRGHGHLLCGHQVLPQSIRSGSLYVSVKLAGGSLGRMPRLSSKRRVLAYDARSWVGQRRAMRRIRLLSTERHP